VIEEYRRQLQKRLEEIDYNRKIEDVWKRINGTQTKSANGVLRYNQRLGEPERV